MSLAKQVSKQSSVLKSLHRHPNGVGLTADILYHIPLVKLQPHAIAFLRPLPSRNSLHGARSLHPRLVLRRRVQTDGLSLESRAHSIVPPNAPFALVFFRELNAHQLGAHSKLQDGSSIRRAAHDTVRVSTRLSGNGGWQPADFGRDAGHDRLHGRVGKVQIKVIPERLGHLVALNHRQTRDLG